MRIVAGALRGRPIIAPPGAATRPTGDRARQAIFNILEHAAFAPALAGARVIDCYAGSGALGLEALSRGADFALFVETDAAARGAINANLEAFGLFGRARVHRRDATNLGPQTTDGRPFDLVFLDPPYARGLGERTLACLIEGDWLAPGALVVFERGAGEPAADVPGYRRLDERRYGAAQVLFLQPA